MMDSIAPEFLIAAVLMELTPGPNMTWLALLSAREGRSTGFRAVAGISLGLALLALAAAVGVATLLTVYPVIYEAVRWAGILFLLYLAFEAWTGEASKPDSQRDSGRHFRRGLVINLLNPKAAAVFVTVIPGFTGAGRSDISATLLLSGVYVLIATLAHVLIVLFASSFQRVIAAPGREVIVRRIFSIMLAGVAIWFAVTTDR